MKFGKRSKFFLGAALVVFALAGWCLFRPIGGADRIPLRLIDFLGSAEAAPGEFPVSLRVAAASVAASRDKETNVSEMERLAQAAKEEYPDLRLVVFGEAALGLYYDPADPPGYQRGVSEPIPGPTSARLGALTRRLGIYLAYGATESAGETLYNTVALIDPEGRVVACHRKMLLHWLDEQGGITQAQPNSQVVEIDGLRFGLAICADANTRWLRDQYVEQKIDVLICPVTSGVPWVTRRLRYWPHAKAYGAWVVAANRFGVEGDDDYPGTVFVAAPNGRMQAVGDLKNAYLTVVIGRQGRPRLAPGTDSGLERGIVDVPPTKGLSQ
jgi:predicted amidohydrolase